jgi:hypothetical protein
MEFHEQRRKQGYREVSYIPVCRRLTMELHEERRKQGI